MTTLDELFELAKQRDSMVLEFGWKANQYIEEVYADDHEAPFRTVLTETLHDLSIKFEAYMSRATLADRVRVTRHFTRELVSHLPGKPTYNQLRACYVSGTWPDANEEKTAERVDWAIMHDWPAPELIRKMGETDIKDPLDKQWRIAREACERVHDNPLQPHPRIQAAGYVLTCMCGEDGKWSEDDAVQDELMERV